jgi:hypothetical protein
MAAGNSGSQRSTSGMRRCRTPANGADKVDQLTAIARDAPNRMRILLNIGRFGNNPNRRGEFPGGLEPANVDNAAPSRLPCH